MGSASYASQPNGLHALDKFGYVSLVPWANVLPRFGPWHFLIFTKMALLVPTGREPAFRHSRFSQTLSKPSARHHVEYVPNTQHVLQAWRCQPFRVK